MFPRVLARPLELRRGQAMTEQQLVDRLNELGYAHRDRIEKAGEFAIGQGAVAIMPRVPELKGQAVRVVFQQPPRPNRSRRGRRRRRRGSPIACSTLELGAKPSERVTLDAPVLTALGGEREKRRPVALAAIPPRMQQAVLAIEDRRFYEHPGFDPIGMAGAVLSNMRGKRATTAAPARSRSRSRATSSCRRCFRA